VESHLGLLRIYPLAVIPCRDLSYSLCYTQWRKADTCECMYLKRPLVAGNRLSFVGMHLDQSSRKRQTLAGMRHDADTDLPSSPLQDHFDATVRTRLGDHSLLVSISPWFDQLHEALFYIITDSHVNSGSTFRYSEATAQIEMLWQWKCRPQQPERPFLQACRKSHSDTVRHKPHKSFTRRRQWYGHTLNLIYIYNTWMKKRRAHEPWRPAGSTTIKRNDL